jgi:hypothetical protein
VKMLCTLAILMMVTVVPCIHGAARADPPPLNSAPDLPVQDLGPMAFKANVTLGPLAPDPAGTGFVQLLFAFPPGDYTSTKEPFEIVSVDLQTGAISRTRASTQAGSAGWRVWTWEWGSDGKLYLGTQGPGHLISWDPKSQKAHDYGVVWNGVDMVYRLVVGADGALYGGGASPSMLFRYDPKADRVQNLGVVGLPRTYQPSYAYTLGADDRYVYVASGKLPWYVVAYDRKTGTQANLLTYGGSDYPEVYQYADAVYVKVMIAEQEGQPRRFEYYRLAEGKATPIAKLPPALSRPTPAPDRNRPEIFLDTRAAPDDGGTVRLWYRPAAAKAAAPQPPPANASLEQLGWNSVRIAATAQPYQLRRLALLPDGRLIGATGNYGDMFTFDPFTGRREVLGNTVDTNVYGMLVSDGKLYYTGYAGAPLCVYDPTRPWTLGKDTPLAKAPDWASPRSNPQRLVSLMATFGVHYGYHIVRDAQDRLYVGCHAERNRVGGALAVYDPKTQQAGGVGEPELTQFDCAGLAATSGGRLIVYSSSLVTDPKRPGSTPPDAKLFVYDPAAGRFVREIVPLPGRTNTGLLATGLPGQVVGASPGPAGKSTTLYAVEVDSGRVLWQRDVPGSVPGRVHQGGFFRRGPDGQIWTFLDRVLVRVRPDTGEVTPVGTVASGPGDVVFVGPDIYLAGTTSLRRIRDVLRPSR